MSKQFGLSDVGLAKICRKNNIPLPERGYWRKKETNKKISQKPLPKSQNQYQNEIRIVYREKVIIPEVTYNDAVTQLIQKEQDFSNRIIVNTDNNDFTHKYAARALKILSNSKINKNGIIESRAKYSPPIYVSKNSLSRSIQILDALLTSLESRGFRIKWPQPNYKYFSIIIENIQIGFSIIEKYNQIDHKPTKEEIAEQKKFSWMKPPRWDYVPNGKLTLNLFTSNILGNIKRTWNDSKRKQIENELNDFIIQLYKIPEEQQKYEDRERQQKIEAAERERQYMEKQRQEMEYRRKMEFLMDAMNNWQQSKLILEFCEKISSISQNKALTESHKNIQEEIILLLTNYADKINPLSFAETFFDKFNVNYKWLW